MNGQRKPAWPPIAAWGVFLAALTAIGLVFFGTRVETPALLGGGAAFVLVLALLLALSRRSLQVDGGGADPDASPATVWLALSLGLTALGAALGPWLVFIGAGMTAAGIAATVRELRAQRAAAARARGEGEGGVTRNAATAARGEGKR